MYLHVLDLISTNLNLPMIEEFFSMEFSFAICGDKSKAAAALTFSTISTQSFIFI